MCNKGMSPVTLCIIQYSLCLFVTKCFGRFWTKCHLILIDFGESFGKYILGSILLMETCCSQEQRQPMILMVSCIWTHDMAYVLTQLRLLTTHPDT